MIELALELLTGLLVLAMGLFAAESTRMVGEKNKIMKDKCVICNTDTQYDEFDHIDVRYFYVEGCGQLCPKCYNDTDPKKEKETK
tara:strand:- start:429 stop:683 length:255 start_codon:yes stop_codon:yes gene_type:complete